MKKKCYIIGGGESVKDVTPDMLKDGDIIAVNKGVAFFPNASFMITMDYTVLTKLPPKLIDSLKNITKVFIANLVPSYMQEINGRFLDTRFDLVYNLKPFDMIIKSHSVTPFGYTWNTFSHGANSGFCAVQFALLMGYKDITLFGFDTIESSTHFHGGYGTPPEVFKERLTKYKYNMIQALREHSRLQRKEKLYIASDKSYLAGWVELREVKS